MPCSHNAPVRRRDPANLRGSQRVSSVTLHSWSEAGATWLCGSDTSPTDDVDDCDSSDAWDMGGTEPPFVVTATDSVNAPCTAEVRFDVTADFKFWREKAGNEHQPQNFGWILVTQDPASVTFASSEAPNKEDRPKIEISAPHLLRNLRDKK